MFEGQAKKLQTPKEKQYKGQTNFSYHRHDNRNQELVGRETINISDKNYNLKKN